MNIGWVIIIVGMIAFLSTRYFIKSEGKAMKFLFNRGKLFEDDSSFVICNHCGNKVKRPLSNRAIQCTKCNNFF